MEEMKNLFSTTRMLRGQDMSEAELMKLKAAGKAHCEKLRPVYEERYKLKGLSDSEVREIERAEADKAECSKCNGQTCHKAGGTRHLKPVIGTADGRLNIMYAICPIKARRDLKERFERMKVPARYQGKNFSDYEVTADNRRAVAIAQWYIDEKPQRNLYFHGGCGTGKTFLTALIAQEFIREGRSVIFGDVPELLEEIKMTFDSDKLKSEDVMNRYYNCDLLIMDDLGAGQVTEWSVGILYQVINRRVNAGKRLIVTSNFDLKGLNQRLATKDAYGARRIISRLSDSVVGYFGTVDRRGA